MASTSNIDDLTYRRILASFVTGVTVVTARDPESGLPRGMTANAFMSVSLAPRLILVSVRRNAHMHPILQRAKSYAVTILGRSLEREARRFAGLPVADHEPPPEFEDRGGVPVLCNGLAWIVADIEDAVLAGDHTIFIGRVIDSSQDRPDEAPLAYYRSSFSDVRSVAGTPPLPLDAWGGGAEMWG